MKTIGILTFHYSDSYGALLQCYALRRVMNRLPDCSAEIINYIPSKFFYQKCWRTQTERKLFLKKREDFQTFLQRKCGITNPPISHIPIDQYDYLCAGSNQVWSMSYPWYKIYFLPYIVHGTKKISYAASVGIGKDFPTFNREFIKKYLSDFHALSVREEEHKELIEELTKQPCACVLDPTLLLCADDYDELICQETFQKERFLFFFWLHVDAGDLMRGVEFANTLSRKYNLPIVHSVIEAEDYLFYNDGGCMMFEGVDRFLWYIKHADYVITNSYHATLFSIQFQKPFWSFIVSHMRSCFDTLANKLGICDRIVKDYLSEEDIQTEIDWKTIFEKLEAERIKSMGYLHYALDFKSKFL